MMVNYITKNHLGDLIYLLYNKKGNILYLYLNYIMNVFYEKKLYNTL